MPRRDVSRPSRTEGPSSTQPTDGDRISGGRLLAKALKHEGVDVIFTLTGGEIVDVLGGCIAEGIRVIDVRHEQPGRSDADETSKHASQL